MHTSPLFIHKCKHSYVTSMLQNLDYPNVFAWSQLHVYIGPSYNTYTRIYFRLIDNSSKNNTESSICS